MAVSRSDIPPWLLVAADNAGADEEDQIDWLREQRKEYSERIKAGDWMKRNRRW
jgi:hypothetical protein